MPKTHNAANLLACLHFNINLRSTEKYFGFPSLMLTQSNKSQMNYGGNERQIRLEEYVCVDEANSYSRLAYSICSFRM